MAIMYYDPVWICDFFQKTQGSSDLLFNSLFEKLPVMEKTSTQRLVVMSFCALMSVPSNLLPQIVGSNLQAMLAQVIREIVIIQESENDDNERDGSRHGDDYGWGDDDDDDGIEVSDEDDDEDDEKRLRRYAALEVPEGGYDEEEDCINAEDEQYLEAIEELEKKEKVKRQMYMAGEPVDDDDLDDEDEFTSPIDTIDVVQHFKNIIQQAASREPALYQQMQARLDDQDKARLAEIMQQLPKNS